MKAQKLGWVICGMMAFSAHAQVLKNPLNKTDKPDVLDSIVKPDYTQYVNPMVGTGGHGHTFPGATLPFGMVQLSPDTRIDNSWDGCSGYHYSDNTIYGFSHTHLSGTGCSDYGDIMIMPMGGDPNSDKKVYSSKFSHINEKSSPGYYSVLLDDDKIKVELTSTRRVGLHKYTATKGGKVSLIMDHTHRDELIESTIKIISTTRIEGMRRSKAWAQNQVVYYVIDFSEQFDKYSIKDHQGKPEAVGAFTFKMSAGKSLYVKVAISFTSIEGARKNLEAEMPFWDFEKVKNDAREAWNKELSKIEVSNEEPEKTKTFYTALYHCMIHPSVASDVDGTYLGRDFKEHKADGFEYYTVFSLWDTYRALHPLFTIIDKKRTLDFIKTFLAQYKDGGRLPVWELASNETDCMIGYHSVSVMADAYVKGIRDFDAELALEAMQKSANEFYRGLPAFNRQGFLEIDDENESVSKTLEYAYDDWCIARMADLMNKPEVYNEYYKRAKGWMNLYNPENGFIQPRTNGGWIAGFDPFEVNNHYTEANGWQYNFHMPQDITSIMRLMGGRDKFVAKLDELFSASTKTTGREQADITGLIGQYAHGNEPSHHLAYLYVFAEQPWKTQELLHRIKTEFYKNSPAGLIGNEDCGQMSAWYVFSALGFYPVCPGSDEYVVGAPSFEKTIIHLENDTTFEVNAINLSDENHYIHYAETYVLSHEEISRGGIFSFTMGKTPVKNIEPVRFVMFPSSNSSQTHGGATGTLRAPVIKTAAKTFKDSLVITLSTREDAKTMFYYDYFECYDDTCMAKIKNKEHEYKGPFTIYDSKYIYTRYVTPNGKSPMVRGYFHKLPNDWSVKIVSKYSKQYSGDGDNTIIDGLHGDINWKKGGWQGYQGQDVEVIIDLQDTMMIAEYGASFLQDSRAWIILPTSVEFSMSMDGKTFTGNQIAYPAVGPKDENVQMVKITSQVKKINNARYIKIKAYTIGKLPEWHQGKGGDAYIFMDEVWVE